MRTWEVPVFFGIALGVHAAAFTVTVESGQDAAPGGPGGDASVTVAAASPAVAALVEQWEAPPEIVEAPASARAPLAPAPRALPKAPLPDAPLPAPALQPPLPMESEEPVQPEPEPEEAVEPPAPEPEPDPKPAQAAEPEPATALVESRRPVPRPERLVRAPAPQPAEPAPQASTARAEQRAAGPRGPATQGETGRAAVATASPGARANLVQVWGAQIQGRLQRALVYPRQAQMRGIAGRAMVELTVGADGRIRGRRLVGSSGSGILDEAALSTVDRARGIPPAPQGVPGNSFTFQLPVVFQGR